MCLSQEGLKFLPENYKILFRFLQSVRFGAFFVFLHICIISFPMISFETKNIEMPCLDFNKINIWLCEVAALYSRKITNLNYLFCDDDEILRVNKEFLKHDYFTDIITFDYSRKDKVGGDIFISLDTVKSNSEDLNTTYENELLRVIVHGLLHLCGIDDKGPGEREIMEQKENEAMALWYNLQKS